MNQVKTLLARKQQRTVTHHVPAVMQATLEYGKQCLYVDGVTQATLCMELFSRLHLLTGSQIPENAQIWANGRVLRRQQTIEEVPLDVDSFFILLRLLMFPSIALFISVLVLRNLISSLFSCSLCYQFTLS